MTDIEEHVLDRIVVVSHVWPGITPHNVWDLSLRVWMRFAAAADAYVKSREQCDGG